MFININLWRIGVVVMNFIKALFANLSIPGLIVIFVLFIVLCVVLVIMYSAKKTKEKDLQLVLEINKRLDSIHTVEGLEGKLTSVLETVKLIIEGDGYFLYLYEENHERYRLERVLYNNESSDPGRGTAEVGYGRLTPYEKESYAPPLFFAKADIPDKTELLMEGRYPLLIIPVKGEKGFVSVYVKKRSTKINSPIFDYISDRFSVAMQSMIDLKGIESGFATNEEDSPEQGEALRILESALPVVGGSAGFFIRIENNYCEYLLAAGFKSETVENLKNDEKLGSMIEGLAEDDALVVLDDKTEGFINIPSYLKEDGYNYFALYKTEHGIITVCFKQYPEDSYFKDYRLRALRLLMAKSADRGKQTNTEYIKKLKVISNLIDQEEPYSVGYSELMSRYTSILTKELNIDPKTAELYQQAAFFSNIGALGVPEKVLRKRGIYTEEEYESIKKHADFGAFIVELFTGNKVIVDSIKYHHERMDGLGYPEGRKGDEIPEGARILAVVQNFLSKYRGRNYRSPLPFGQIFDFLKEESGKGLDPVMVDALLYWFKRKQENPIFIGRPLGSCWEMRCASEEICGKCPAYKRTDKYCWEFDNTNCKEHGNVCETCPIYTEFIYRNSQNTKESERI